MDARVEDYLNDKLQTLADFETLDSLLVNLKTQQNLLQEQLREAEGELRHADETARNHEASTQDLAAQFEAKQADIDRRLLIVTNSDTSEDAVTKFEESMHKLHVLDVASGYMSTMAEVNRLSISCTENALEQPQTALGAYNSLFELHRSLRLNQTAAERAAPHLVDHTHHALSTTRQTLKDTFAKQLQKPLDKVLWPKPGVSMPESVEPEFRDVFSKLLALQQPELEQSIADSANSSVLYPFEILVKPLAQRFDFHFTGNKPTNRPDKPEYFFSHFIDVLDAHADFMADYVQPILLRHFRGTDLTRQLAYVDAMTAFITAFLPVLKAKLRSLVRQVSGQPRVLSHLMHELQSFDTLLREDWRYEPNLASQWKGVTHDLLSENDLFNYWLNVEKDFALSRYKTILAGQSGSNLDFDSVASNSTKPTKHAIRVHDLLSAVTDDYRGLQSFSQKLRFLIDVQIAIFDQYHAYLHSGLDAFILSSSSIGRTVQGASAEDVASLHGVRGLERLCRIFGSCDYLERAMRDWSDDVFFLDLWTELQSRAQDGGRVTSDISIQDVAQHTSTSLTKPQDDETGGLVNGALFDETAGAYSRLRDKSEKLIVERFTSSVLEALRAYSKTADRWTAAASAGSEADVPPNSSLSTALTVISEGLDFLRRALAPLPLRRVLRAVSKAADTHIWDRVILANNFTLQGSIQLASDVAAVELALGREGGSLQRSREGLSLLTLGETAENGDDSAAAMSLEDADRRIFADNESARQALEELSIFVLTENEARNVLRNRSRDSSL